MSSATIGIGDPRSLLGAWDFTRAIVDHRAASEYVVTGRAVFEPFGETIRWHESGLLQRDGGEHPVMRTLLLRPAAGEGYWTVEFDDGRPFHDWMLGTRLLHECGADTYRGRVALVDAEVWSIDWNVSGPVKDYVLTTTYRKPRMPDRAIA